MYFIELYEAKYIINTIIMIHTKLIEIWSVITNRYKIIINYQWITKTK